MKSYYLFVIFLFVFSTFFLGCEEEEDYRDRYCGVYKGSGFYGVSTPQMFDYWEGPTTVNVSKLEDEDKIQTEITEHAIYGNHILIWTLNLGDSITLYSSGSDSVMFKGDSLEFSTVSGNAFRTSGFRFSGVKQ